MSLNTPMLLEVPRDRPTRKELLAQFKSRHGIETHKNTGMDWLACHMPSARKFGYGVTDKSDLYDCFSKVGRLLDESGVAAYGDTEREAITQLCHNLALKEFPQ